MFETFYGEVVGCQLNLPVERIQGVNSGLAASAAADEVDNLQPVAFSELD